MTNPSHHLARGVHAAVCGQDLVLLDVAADAYVCLPALGELATGLPRRDLAGLPEAALAELRQANLACSEPSRWTGLSAQPATRDLFAEPWPAPGRREVFDFWQLLPVAVAGFWRRDFAGLLRQGAGWTRGDAVSAALIRRALVFRRLLPWSPIQGACLFQAYWLLRYLRSAGLGARWVFGVKTWPFGAHCWLQADELVLTDTADHVGAYQPILIL